MELETSTARVRQGQKGSSARSAADSSTSVFFSSGHTPFFLRGSHGIAKSHAILWHTQM